MLHCGQSKDRTEIIQGQSLRPCSAPYIVTFSLTHTTHTQTKHTHTHNTVSFAETNCRRNWSHLSTGWIPTLHQRMQKIGEHLDSGDDTSICAAPVTGALQFLPCGGVRSAGHLPSCLAEAWSTGTGPWNWRPGLACQPKSPSLSPSPSLASQVLIRVPLVSLLCQEQSLARCPWPLFLYPFLSCKSVPRHHRSSSLPCISFKSPSTACQPLFQF